MVATLCRTQGRDHLARSLAIARSRVDRQQVLIAVVGEYKQGKSSLINAFLGTPVCPVDADLATSALTLVSRSADPSVTVHRSLAGQPQTAERIPTAELPRWAQEDGTAERVDVIEVGVADAILPAGVTLIDTPGVGGFRGGYQQAVLSFLPLVDAMVFVDDASSELAPAAARFLAQAATRCPVVVFALTKIDMYPEWRRIMDADRDRLRAIGIETTIHPVSSALRSRAVRLDDATLNTESGAETLLNEIGSRVVAPARSAAASRAKAEAMAALDEIGAALQAELQALEHPESEADLAAQLAEAEKRQRDLRAAAGRWGQLLADALADLRMDLDQRTRSGLREIVEDCEARLESVRSQADQERLFGEARERTAEIVRTVFSTIEEREAAIVQDVFALVSPDASAELGVARPEIDLAALATKARPKAAGPKGNTVEWGLGALRGAQGGGYLIAWLGGVAGMTVAPPLALAAGTAFAAKFVFDERTRQAERRRQEARAMIRQFVDAAQFELASRIGTVMVSLQRAIRDEMQRRLEGELEGSGARLAALRDAAQRDVSSRTARLRQVREIVRQSDGLRAAVAGIGAVTETP